MFRLFAVVFLIIGLAGCAAGTKKQTIQQSSPVIEERAQRTYEREDNYRDYNDGYSVSSGSYRKPVKKTYSEPVAELSAKQIQKALKNAGFYQGPIDGKLGPKTKAAIKKFQKTNGLQPDGVVGKVTSAELKRYLFR